MAGLDYGVIGNCNIACLVDAEATIVWGCFPRLDGDPLFCSLLDGDHSHRLPEHRYGMFAIEVINAERYEQAYLENSAILRTTVTDARDAAVEITDFAPRYQQFARYFRPPMIVRRISPLRGRPRIRIRLRPLFEDGSRAPEITRGSNHVRFVSPSLTMRLTTNGPSSYITEERIFLLDQPIDLIFGSDEALNAPIESTARELYERTLDHWRSWVRSLSIPFEWQEAVIRAAITLKLCNFEETGAIVAALTTSIPEAPGTGRNWDYRFCWLRDAYFVIHALNRLGTTRTMESYLSFIGNIVEEANDADLRPVYGITRYTDMDERIVPALAGFRGSGPVRMGNQAHLQIQNDVYGSVVLASAHAFFDHRLARRGDVTLYHQLERLGLRAVAKFDKPDAGPWEFRGIALTHTFSGVMCWAACDRLARIAEHLGWQGRAKAWRKRADRLHRKICAQCWNKKLGSFVSSFGGDKLDATLLLLHEVNFLAADDPRFLATVEAVGNRLKRGDFLFRYDMQDDFGQPETAFIICVFWYIDALAALGRSEEARALFESVLARRNPLGLLSEDIDHKTFELWGNFPQTYSMVGLINSAVRLSSSWEEVF